MKAYVFVQTKLGESSEVIEDLRKGHEESFRKGSPVYGWYDVMVEFEILDVKELGCIVDDLKHNCLDIVHVGTAVERVDASSPLLSMNRARS